MKEALKKLGIVYDDMDKTYTIKKDGMEIGYESLRDAIWVGIFDFCNCGDPDKHLIKMYDLLSAMDEESPKAPADEDVIYLYHLDSKGMTEHGCSVRFSWLNDKGRALMKVIKAAVRTNYNKEETK